MSLLNCIDVSFELDSSEDAFESLIRAHAVAVWEEKIDLCILELYFVDSEFYLLNVMFKTLFCSKANLYVSEAVMEGGPLYAKKSFMKCVNFRI